MRPRPHHAPHRLARTSGAFALVAALASALTSSGCGDSDAEADASPVPTDAAAPVTDIGVALDAAVGDAAPPGLDAAPPVGLRAVGGDLTYAELSAEGGALYSVQTDGELRTRLTAGGSHWGEHAVGPEPRYLVALRYTGRDEHGWLVGPASVWIIDVRTQTQWPISPELCDAAHGGVGWADPVRVVYVADCGDGPAAAYLAGRDDRSRDRANHLRIAGHDRPMRDVFPATGTALMAYTVDDEVCSGGSCVAKPSVWIGAMDAPQRCRVTDGDPGYLDIATVTGPRLRVGDHQPAFTRALDGVTFSRNTEGPSGPHGHLAPMYVGFSRQALFGGQEQCGVDGSLTALGDAAFADEVPDRSGASVRGSVYGLQSAAGRSAVEGGYLFTASGVGPGGVARAVYRVEQTGERSSLTAPRGDAAFARWIVENYQTDGER